MASQEEYERNIARREEYERTVLRAARTYCKARYSYYNGHDEQRLDVDSNTVAGSDWFRAVVEPLVTEVLELRRTVRNLSNEAQGAS